MPARELEAWEEELQDRGELVLRLVNRRYVVDDDEVMPDAFVLSGMDREKQQLSGARSSKQTPKGAYDEAVEPSRYGGTWAVSVAEVQDQGSRAVDDTAEPLSPCLSAKPTGHVYIDYSLIEGRTKPERALFRQALALHATERGRLYPEQRDG